MDIKRYLDLPGLQTYDELLKKYLENKIDSVDSELRELIQGLDGTVDERVSDIEDALEVLNGDGEGSINKTVTDAIASVIDGAPEALDTLKEIADWIAQDEEGAAALTNRVAKNEDDIADLKQENEDLKAYIDKKDLEVYSSITSIDDIQIISLFKNRVELDENKTVSQAISELSSDEMLVLPEDSTIAEDLVITDDAYIDANGSTFTGTITVAENKNVVIANATFENPVVVG